jgi:phosphate transport system protein
MTHLDTELKDLKANLIEMWGIIVGQLVKSHEAVISFDKDLAHEVTTNEKRIDAYELKINMDCENILALFNPVANDLRLILAVLRINNDLERIGDYARSVAKMVLDTEKPFDDENLTSAHISEMFHVAIKMVGSALESFENEDKRLVRTVFMDDDELDKVNKSANDIIISLIKTKPDDIRSILDLLTIIRKLERVGDQTKNIAEEIVFYAEAKVLRHKKKKEKLEE